MLESLTWSLMGVGVKKPNFIEKSLFNKLKGEDDLPLSDLRNVWFQHDGAPPHKVSNVQQDIRDTFQQQVIGYGGCAEWPPRSSDLNPLDFFLWGYIKQRVYATPPPIFQELQNRITDACASVSPAMLNNVQREVQSRVQMCIVAEGHHFEHVR
ncbi:hypothetical protein AVEN_225258-1 [Araneus ventricosus]|uniref:Tc1-like transposase DDE domain-containing protein n=1 Tax=Araneus ventricosus TaxID=182803 RepID=A0A4Y2ALQ6_ARAVE|nr:hypothetical protein AVEN_225258-1 [Araneus ventricosus]